MTSMRRNDVASMSFRRHVPTRFLINVISTSFRRHVPTRFLINQCQIITFDNIENSRIELKGRVLPIPSNQIKVIFIILLPFNGDFFLFHIEIEGNVGGLLGGGGLQRVCCPPSQVIGGPLPPPPPLFFCL